MPAAMRQSASGGLGDPTDELRWDARVAPNEIGVAAKYGVITAPGIMEVEDQIQVILRRAVLEFRWVRFAILLSFAACSTAGKPDQPDGTGSGCVLGTADHCGTCDTVCPGMDSASTLRTCSSNTATGTCNITCRGEFYDLDGDATNGCEAEDQPPQDMVVTAVMIALPNVNNGSGSTACDGATNPCTHAAQIYSDTRLHENAPTMRGLGREDWYQLVATGAGGSGQVGACLGITNFPADDRFEICIGDNGSTNPTTCATAIGSTPSTCVAPPTAADSGTFYIRLRKLSGSNTANKYALYVQH
jgi:hypothetical protein